MKDSWNIGPDGRVHFAVAGTAWACRKGSGGPVIGDAPPGGPTPNGACEGCLNPPAEEEQR